MSLWFSLCRFYVSRNLFISSVIQSVSLQLFIIPCYNLFHFCKIDSSVSTFMSDFSNLSLLSLFFLSLFGQWLVNYVALFKESSFGFISFLYSLSLCVISDFSSFILFHVC